VKWKRFAAVATLVFASAISGYHLKAHAQQDFPPPCTVVVPTEWGKYRGTPLGVVSQFDR
jgi:hypothetical protein